MASSSSSHHYDVASGPLEDDLLWMQKNHVSQHIWNGANDRTLKLQYRKKKKLIVTHIINNK